MLPHSNQETPLGDDQNSESDHQPSTSDHQLSPDASENALARKTGKWTSEEDDLLRKFVPLFGEKQWRKISENIPGRSSIQCLHRWTKILKPGLVKGRWTAEEDQKLVTWVKTEGASKWAQCANFIKGRSGKQCRERWFNNLNPDVKKGNWSKEEDELIFQLYQKYGSSWSKVAKFLPGRTENAIKNRFYSTLRRLAADKKKGKGENDDETEVKLEDNVKLEMPVSVAGQNKLYALLNEKTCEVMDQEESEEKKEEEPEKVKGKKSKQAFNVNGEKILVKRDSKVDERKIEEKMSRLMGNDIEDNDAVFEDFLATLDCSLKDDFLTKELDLGSKADDISQFEDLQRKVLSYCQANITHLSETFKTIDTNKASTTVSEVSQSEGRGNVQPPRGATMVLTPKQTPTQPKVIKVQQFTGEKGPSANAFSLYNQGNRGSPKMESEKSSEKAVRENERRMEPEETEKKVDMQRELMGRQDNKVTGATDAEKRLTFLFQQLYSLETLLSKTKKDLVQFESSLKGGKEAVPGDIKREEDRLDSEFDQVVKKKKVV